MNTVYVAYPVTNTFEDSEPVKALIQWLIHQGWTVVEPALGLEPETIAERAIEKIKCSDVIIGDVSSYSHGVGIELGFAYALDKPTIIIANKRANPSISKFVTGLFPIIVQYRSAQDLIDTVAPLIGQQTSKETLAINLFSYNEPKQ